VSYAVASENESFTSYPYDRYLGNVNASTSPASLASTIVDEHHQSLPGYPRTLAAFDLSRMSGVSSAVDAFAKSLLDADNQIPEAYRSGLMSAFSQTQKLDSNVDLSIDDKDGYVDLYHFADRVRDQINDGGVDNAAQALMDTLAGETNPLITNNKAGSGFYAGKQWNLENANDLSVYLPLGEPDWRQDFYNANELSFARDTMWDEFVQAMVNLTPFNSDERPVELDPSNRPGPLEVSTYSVYVPNVGK
jgi:hypothetical protein